MKTTRWRIERAEEDSEALRRLLLEDWEPFSAVWNDGNRIIYVRKLVRLDLYDMMTLKRLKAKK